MSLLGQKVRCRVTGFQGTVTKRMEVLHGSSQVFVEGFDNGFRRDEWMEEKRVELCDEVKLAPVTTIRPPPP